MSRPAATRRPAAASSPAAASNPAAASHPTASRSKPVALILAAGESKRAQSGDAATPKPYRLLAGPLGLAPMLRHSLQMLLRHEGIGAVRCVIQPDHRLLYQQACEGLEGRLLAPVSGGPSRYHSAWLGLQSLRPRKPRLVLIHDAARPFASPHLVCALQAALAPGADGAVPALPILDAMKRVRRGRLVGQIARAHAWRAQTPQLFRYAQLLAAYDALGDAPKPVPHDDSEVAQRAGLNLVCVPGQTDNEKLTFAADFAAARPSSPPPMLRRIGLGFDSHAFGKGDAIRLGGARIPAPHGVCAHSDGDVLLHALCDALYGAVAAGDIGVHFPPDDARNRGRASADFLRHALAHVRACGARLQQIDMVLLADVPKLAPHRAAILRSLHALLRACDSPLTPPQIGFKATTSEGLGVAAKSGIAAWVMVGLT